jgi:circadian clock protein KaiC
MADKPSSSQPPAVSTGVAGLDELLQGGLTPNRMYLVEGLPGAGKTTLGMQFLLDGRDRGERTLYVTLSETTIELTGVADSHGWSLEGIELYQLAATETARPEEQYTLYHPAEVELGETIKNVLEAVERVRPSRIVFDSLSELRLLARDPLRYRRQILALKDFFAGRETTVLLLDDHAGGEGDRQLQSLAHGVILLEQLPFEYGRARRRIRIVKFRGVAAIEGFHDFTIRHGGIAVFPQLVVRPDQRPRETREPLTSGLAELDQLLGGGLSWGSSTLVIGPAGTGKSTLAAQYIYADSVRSAAFLFDERRASFVARCDAIGMRMTDHIATGAVSVDQIEPGQLSPGEFSHRVRDAVDGGARLVYIDSVNGYLNAIPQVEAPLVRLHELLSFLNEAGIVTILVVAQHGIVGASMPAPIDVSYLADTVILLRFFEAHGAVRRAVSVVKKRTGAHETTIREFQIGPERIRVGGALTEFQGVLTGVPHYVGEGAPLLPNVRK